MRGIGKLILNPSFSGSNTQVRPRPDTITVQPIRSTSTAIQATKAAAPVLCQITVYGILLSKFVHLLRYWIER